MHTFLSCFWRPCNSMWGCNSFVVRCCSNFHKQFRSWAGGERKMLSVSRRKNCCHVVYPQKHAHPLIYEELWHVTPISGIVDRLPGTYHSDFSSRDFNIPLPSPVQNFRYAHMPGIMARRYRKSSPGMDFFPIKSREIKCIASSVSMLCAGAHSQTN